MAVTQQQLLPAPFLTDVTKTYAKDLGALTAAPLDTSQFAPQVAGQDPLQTQAYNLAGAGIGAYQPYLTQAGAYTGPGSQAAFMSPYQQDVIDTTMQQYDTQAAKGLTGIGQMAARSGNLGGGREGVMRSEYQTESDLKRAALLAQLQQQGFGQAQTAAQQAYANQMQMGQGIQQFQGADVASLGQMGATQQAQAQAQLDATRERERLEAYEPYERLGYLGSGLGSMLSGYPAQFQSSVAPNPTPLQTALGIASVGGGVLGNLYGNQGAPWMPGWQKP
jgi:hypothetical protein